jgi:hypothetical protein
VGTEFRENTYTTNAQYTPKVATDQAGDYVAVWYSGAQDGSGFGIYGQRYNSSGVAQGSEFRVNVYTTGNQENPVVAMDQAGDFVVAWASAGQDGSGYGVYARRYNAAGAAQSSEFRVNTYTTGNQVISSVAMDQVGDFTVVWLSGGQDGSDYGIYAQRYNSVGAAQSGEFRVNTYTTNGQYAAKIAMDSAGDSVVVWQSDGEDGSLLGIYGQRYNAAGVAQGGEFRVNTYTTGNQGIPAVAMDQAGDFVAAWYSDGQDGSSYGIFAQRYNAAGLPQNGEFQVNTYTTGSQISAAVAMDQAGDYVIAWQSINEDGSLFGVFAQAFHANGTANGGEYRTNTYTTSNQQYPSVAMDAASDFVITWQSNGQDGSSYGAYAQRFHLSNLPQVAGVQVNDGSAQRSRVTSLTITLSTQVTFAGLPSAAFTITRNSDGAAIGFTATPTVTAGGYTQVLLNNFTGAATDFGSLADGRYTFTALASQISGAGIALDGNGDGVAGDDYALVGDPATNKLFRLFGDANGDGTVAASDFILFRQMFGGASTIFDFSGDGTVSANDFAQFRLRFGGSI